MKKITLLSIALLFGFAAIAQTIIIEEGFNDVTTLVGSEFEIYNASDAPDSSVFQGDETIFASYDGSPSAFAAMNYQATSASTVDLYLVTPSVQLKNGDLVQFWTRTVENSGFPDRLEVRLDPTGDGTAPEEGDQGSYTELLAEINPDLEPGGYPEEWTQIVAEVTGITGTVETRVALRYWVTDGGPTGANSNYIGVDRLEVISTTTTGGTTFITCADDVFNDTYCYTNNDTTDKVYTSDTGLPLRLTFTGGTVELNFDEVIILDSDGVTNLNTGNPYGNNGDMTGFVFESSGDTLTLRVNSDGSESCENGSGSFVPLIYDISCLPPPGSDIIVRPSNDGTALISTHGNDDLGVYCADFFTLNEPIVLDNFTFDGYTSSNGPIASLLLGAELYIYQDAGANPDGNPTAGNAFVNLTNIQQNAGLELLTDEGGSTIFQINVTAANGGNPIILPAGSYWVAFAPFVQGTSAGAGRWNWNGSSITPANQPVLIDPGDIFGTGATDWTNISSLIGQDFPSLAWTLTSGGTTTPCQSTPAITNPISDYVVCDLDGNGIETFDLTSKDQEILNTLVDVTLSYHLSLADAESGSSPIPIPTTYQNLSNPQAIWIRAIDDTTSNPVCYSVGVFDLIVEPTPDFSPIPAITSADDEVLDGITQFDLNSYIPEITFGNPDLTVTFHLTGSDAQNGVQNLPGLYTNLSNPQTIYARVSDNNTGCYGIFAIDLLVVPPPPICNINIPSNAITGSADLGGSGSNIRWLCENDVVSSNGGGSNTYFIEDGGIVNSSGGGSHIIYVKNGGTLNIDGGGGGISVFYESNAIINNNLSGGGSNTFTLCPSIIFDYTNAPSSSCNPSGSDIIVRPSNGGNAIISTHGNDDLGVYCADFFTLDEPIVLGDFTFDGYALNAPIASLLLGAELYIYQDAGANPDGNPTVGNAFVNLTNIQQNAGLELLSDQTGSTIFQVNVTAANGGNPIILPAGSYWIAFAPFVQGGTDGAGRWNWNGSSITPANQPVLIDPGDIFGTGATDWTNISSLIGQDFPSLAWTLTSGETTTPCQIDTTPPVLTCPDDQTASADTGCMFTIPDYTGLANATDNCEVTSITQDPIAGTMVDTGSLIINLTASDGTNTTVCNFILSVIDTTPPVLNCPDDQTASADTGCMFTISDYTGLATATDNCAVTSITQDPIAGTMVDTGSLIITLTASDGTNTTVCNFILSVIDTTPPVLNCPDDQTVDSEGPYSLPDYFATGQATATDNCTNPVTVTDQIPNPGALLENGTYTITLTTQDENGLEDECSFTLVVNDLLETQTNELSLAGLRLYPNPASDKVIISNPGLLELETISVYDLNGRLMIKNNMEGIESITIDTSILQSATYMIVIESKYGNIVKRLLIE
ncbi:choice-of-anchor J domain-containing protein [bacterium]|nr:choice-of-anchor J domain-containing protein [bacterium]